MLATAWGYLALLAVGVTSGALLVINGVNALLHTIAVTAIPSGIRTLPFG